MPDPSSSANSATTVNLDCRGIPCPQPVLRCRQALESAPSAVDVTVDNDAARQNVSRFLASQGYEVVRDHAEGGLFHLSAVRKAGTGQGEACEVCQVMDDAEIARAARKVAVFITADAIGRGDDELGGKLMGNFLATLPELGPELWRLILVNGGVRLAVQGSPVLDKLQALADAGVDILVCGTCLEHFGLGAQKALGETTNMLDVVTSLGLADKVIQV